MRAKEQNNSETYDKHSHNTLLRYILLGFSYLISKVVNHLMSSKASRAIDINGYDFYNLLDSKYFYHVAQLNFRIWILRPFKNLMHVNNAFR